jgi:hypothetical protein
MFALAMKHGITAAEIRDLVYGFPTFSADNISSRQPFRQLSLPLLDAPDRCQRQAAFSHQASITF